MIQKLFVLIGLFVVLKATNVYAKEKNEEPIDFEDVKKLGRYEPIVEFSDGSKIECGRTLSNEEYEEAAQSGSC